MRTYRRISISLFLAVVLFGGQQLFRSTPSVTAGCGGGPWKKSITIDKTKVPNTNQTNFPVLVSLTDAALKTVANGGKVQNANGYDIGLYSDSNLATKLDWETERYIATTGEVIYWVRVPTVSTSTNTVIYLGYGSTSITTDQSNKTGVWDSNYKAVYHLPDGSSLTANDSTSGAHNSTTLTSTATTGKIGGGASFDGTSGKLIVIPYSSDFVFTSQNFTAEFWINTTTAAVDGVPMGMSEYVTSGWGTYYNSAKALSLSVQKAGTQYFIDTASSFTASTWHHVTMARTGTAPPSGYIYVDGAAQTLGTDFMGTGDTDATHSFRLGHGWYSGAVSNHVNGALDEMRVSLTARSVDWVVTSYNSQNSPSTFFALGSEVACP